jgi:hypothetical protein
MAGHDLNLELDAQDWVLVGQQLVEERAAGRRVLTERHRG